MQLVVRGLEGAAANSALCESEADKEATLIAVVVGIESFRICLNEEQQIASEVVTDNDNNICMLEKRNKSKAYTVEFLKGKEMSKHSQVLALLDEAKKRGGPSEALANEKDPRESYLASSKDLVEVTSLNREVANLCRQLKVAVAQSEQQVRRKKLKGVAMKPNMMLRGKIPSK